MSADRATSFVIPANTIERDDLNLLVIRVEHTGLATLLEPTLKLRGEGSDLTLAGQWQFRIGDDPTWSNIPLPAKFGMPPDVVFEPSR